MIPRTAIGRFLSTLAVLMLIAAILGVCQGCIATTADLERVHERIEESEERISAVVEDVRAGLSTHDDVLDAVQDELAKTVGEADDVARQSHQRGIGVLEAALYLAGQVVTGATTYLVINRTRDRRRVRRGEPVKPSEVA